jgi:26S proteasome regulatory subunit N3
VVRAGDLGRFTETAEQFREDFIRDKNYKLVLRLRHNVIKTGIRMINVSYSRISPGDCHQAPSNAKRKPRKPRVKKNNLTAGLQLESAEDAEFLVAKAIRDGVVDASIDHDQVHIIIIFFLLTTLAWLRLADSATVASLLGTVGKKKKKFSI